MDPATKGAWFQGAALVLLAAALVVVAVKVLFFMAPAESEVPADPDSDGGAPAATMPTPGGAASLPPSAVPLIAGELIYVQGDTLFHVVRTEEGGLGVKEVYRLTRDARRHSAPATGRSNHLWYLDPLGAQRLEAIAPLRDRFARLGASTTTEATLFEETERLAEALRTCEDYPFLLTQLSPEKSYALRRAAALSLGRAGFDEAVPQLIEVFERDTGPGRALAEQLLGTLTGLTPTADGESDLRAAETWRAWWLENGP